MEKTEELRLEPQVGNITVSPNKAPMGLGHQGPTEVQAQWAKYKKIISGWGAQDEMQFGKLQSYKQIWPEWPCTKQVSHGPLLCIGQTGLSVFGICLSGVSPSPTPPGPALRAKYKRFISGGDSPEDERRRQLPVYKIRTQGAPNKKMI